MVAMDEKELLRRYNNLYLSALMRYRKYIEENETLYASELPILVTPNDDAVVGIAGIIKDSFNAYSYGRDFYAAVKLAYEYVNEDIATVTMPVQFWLTPEETIKAGAGDVVDKATLLCSIIIALGNVSATIIATVSDVGRKFVVCVDANGKALGIDVERGISEYASKEALLKGLSVGSNSDMIAYEFNDKHYVDL